MKDEACIYQHFPPFKPFKDKRVGDCDKCIPDEKNLDCPMYSPRFNESATYYLKGMRRGGR